MGDGLESSKSTEASEPTSFGSVKECMVEEAFLPREAGAETILDVCGPTALGSSQVCHMELVTHRLPNDNHLPQDGFAEAAAPESPLSADVQQPLTQSKEPPAEECGAISGREIKANGDQADPCLPSLQLSSKLLQQKSPINLDVGCVDATHDMRCEEGMNSACNTFTSESVQKVNISTSLDDFITGADELVSSPVVPSEDDDLLTVLDKELSPGKHRSCSGGQQQLSLLEEANRRLLKQLEMVQLERDNAEAHYTNSQAELLQQLKKLEKANAEQGVEIKVLKDTLSANEVTFRAHALEMREQHVTAMEQITRRYNECKEEKESAVVRYAQTERKVMQQQAVIEKLEIKVLEKEREKDLLLEKVKTAKNEKQKIVDGFEEKSSEIQQLRKEIEKQKESLSTLDNKAKWAQNRLKSELEAHKESKQKLDELTRKLNEAREEAEQIRKNCQEIIKTYQESEEIKSNSLDLELKKKEHELRAHLMEKENTSEALTMRQKELDDLKAFCKEKSDMLVALEEKVRQLETQRAADERILGDLRATLEHQRLENAGLQEKLLQYLTLEEMLECEKQTAERMSRQIADVLTTNGELQAEMDACRLRQDEMLALTQKMAERNASLTSENTNLHSRLSAATHECSTLSTSLSEFKAACERLTYDSDGIKKKYEGELSSLHRQLEESQRLSESLSRELDDERAEIKTLKKKHALSLKELTRELQLMRKKVEGYESHAAERPNGLATHSRTNSCGSSDAVDAAIGKGDWIVVNPKSVPAPSSLSLHSPSADLAASQLLPDTRFVEPDKQKLIEKVVKLQRALARSGDKIEFLEDHNKQLLEEVQKKSRIIQLYVMREDTGSVSADFVDKHKLKAARRELKEQLAKKGASTFSDGRITLELSMEMNHKLQAVLEDTLLKNMTLKDNIDTLGKEIARLSQSNRVVNSDAGDDAR